MGTYKIILRRRSIRRFKQKQIPLKILKECVNAARLAPSGMNRQLLEYIIVNKKGYLDGIFESIKWASYLKPEWKPEPNEIPTAYIVVIAPIEHKNDIQRDSGLAVENILLTAEDRNIGSCLVLNIDRKKIQETLGIDDERFYIDCVIAMGYKAEWPKTCYMENSIEYYREDGVLYVPKRNLLDILHIA